MTIFLRGACALLAAATFGGVATAQQADTGVLLTMFDEDSSDINTIQQVSCDSGACEYDACAPSCDLGCEDGGCGVGGGMLGLPPGQVFFAAEWLNVRASFSEATAYRRRTLGPPVVDDLVQHTFDYGSSYRLSGGYRLCGCGDEIRFTYTRFDSEGGYDPVSTDPANGVTIVTAFELALVDPLDSAQGRSRATVDNYDIGYNKTIPLGCPLVGCCDTGCGDCCDTGCGDCCGCGPVCPAWDLTFGGGLRIASAGSELGAFTVRQGTAAPTSSSSSTVNFDGVGLRFGVGGRRYFGKTGAVSAYVRGDISLLLGEVDHRVQSQPGLTPTQIRTTQVVPVTDIEAGVTAALTQNVTFTAGYLLSAWHDLGHRAEYDYTITGTQIQSMDDANLMTFDGMFLRAEVAF